MPNKWKLYNIGVRLLCKGRNKNEDIPVTVIDWYDTEKDPVVYRVRTDDGSEILCSHDQLKPLEK